MAEQIFSIANASALVGWVLLAGLPRRRWAVWVSSLLLPSLLAGAYIVIMVAAWGSGSGGFSSLAAVAELFDSPWLLLAGWVHYLAFDLFVGGWIVRDAAGRGIAHVWLLPALLATFLFGPAGWLSYLCLRAAIGGRTEARRLAPAGPASSP